MERHNYTITYAGRLSGIEKTLKPANNYLTWPTLYEAKSLLIDYAEQLPEPDKKELLRGVRAIREKDLEWDSTNPDQ